MKIQRFGFDKLRGKLGKCWTLSQHMIACEPSHTTTFAFCNEQILVSKRSFNDLLLNTKARRKGYVLKYPWILRFFPTEVYRFPI